jgi:hypothetical protein
VHRKHRSFGRGFNISLIYRTFPLGARCAGCWPASCDGMQDAYCRHGVGRLNGYEGLMTMFMHRIMATAAAVALALLSGTAGQAQQPPGTQVGMLTCQMAPSIGFIVGSVQSMRCRFLPNGGYPPQIYIGEFDTVGLDVGITAGGALAWGVFAPTEGPPAGGLAGVYVGASGDVSVGVGVGANVLCGGSNRTIALQRVSVEGEVGVALALGVSSLKLAAAF